MTLLAVFRSRAQALDFSAALKTAGVPAQAIATPREARVGCGISIKFDDRFVSRARAVLGGKGYSAFSGLMKGGPNGYFYL